MEDLNEFKDLLQHSEFRLMIRNAVIETISQIRSSPEHDLKAILHKLKGSGLTLKDIPDLLESFRFMVLVFDNKELLGDLISDLDINIVENYVTEFLALADKHGGA